MMDWGLEPLDSGTNVGALPGDATLGVSAQSYETTETTQTSRLSAADYITDVAIPEGFHQLRGSVDSLADRVSGLEDRVDQLRQAVELQTTASQVEVLERIGQFEASAVQQLAAFRDAITRLNQEVVQNTAVAEPMWVVAHRV
ncbi:hypothetical protein ACJZ2D_006610 [Fusarium nematophilum]